MILSKPAYWKELDRIGDIPAPHSVHDAFHFCDDLQSLVHSMK